MLFRSGVALPAALALSSDFSGAVAHAGLTGLVIVATPTAALREMLSACNHGWNMYPDLLHGAYETLKAHGSDELKARYLGGMVRPVAPAAAGQPAPDVILDILQELREKIVVALNSSGQVREFQLRLRVKFRIRTPQGLELVPDSEIVQKRDISFNESAVLAKEAEEGLLYRNMQSDIVQQLMRRLAKVRLDHAARP